MSDEVQCPHCEEALSDVQFYKWGNGDTIEIDCPHCNKRVLITREFEATYETFPAE